MSAANTPSWDRDPVADANPELPRKRERHSEETETSPLSAGNTDALLVEALPPEDLGTSYDNAIELHDDPVMAASFSDGFSLQPDVPLSPVEQLNHLLKVTSDGFNLDPTHVDSLARWVVNHVANTRHNTRLWRDGYLEEYEFFGKVGHACWAILDFPDDLFDASALMAYNLDRVGEALTAFIPALTEMSIRFLSLLPSFVDTLVTRRDSGQVPKTRQNIDFLWYLQILAQVLANHRCNAMDYLRNTFHLKPKATQRNQQAFFVQHSSASSSLIELLGKLAQHHRDVANAWDGIDAILRIVQNLPIGSYKGVQQVMDTAHHYILPVICEKHPRALPDGFHELLIYQGDTLLQGLCAESNLDGILALYEQYIKGDDDALLPELINDVPLANLMQEVSNGDSNTLNELMTTAWTLKALKSFIYSDIMDVRSCGISLLSKQMLQLFNKHQQSREGFEHPVLQYVARFMRSNELTKYIFGPNSHASLVNHSQHIISFLAATCAYTDLETDIIWHACTNSVEAEFVKASFTVLVDLCRYLDLDHLIYLANKYAVTPPSKLGKDAVDSLTDLFQRVQIKGGESGDQRHRLATAFISIDIMMQISEVEENLPLMRLRDIARSELERFTDRTYSAEDRTQIYSRCVPALVNHDKHATTSVEILVLFLRTRQSEEEVETLLGMLPLQDVVDELGLYIEDHRNASVRQHDACISAIEVRMEAIVRLMGLHQANIGEDVVPPFFRYSVGDLALSNPCRDRCWQLLMTLASKQDLMSTAGELLRRFIAEEAAALPIELVTPELIKLFGHRLRQECNIPPLATNFSLILETAIWKKLVETAEGVDAPVVSQFATTMICEMLFEFPLHNHHHKDTAIKCHADFASQQITRICQEADELSDANNGSICQKLSLLHAVLERSRETQQLYGADIRSELELAAEPESEVFHCSLQIYGGGQTHPRPLRLQAKLSNTLSDLVAKLPDITGAAENRVILGGKSLDLETKSEESLLDLGIHPATVISICPRYTFASDLGLILSSPGPVEHEVLDRYDELEKLLDGPDNVAKQVYSFIHRVRPPTATRRRTISDDTAVDELCPPTKPWRTIFSFFVLKCHLMDFAHLGVADENFLLRGVKIFVHVLADMDRSFHADVIFFALDCLVAFLREQSDSKTSDPISDPATFASSMIEICSRIQSETEDAQIRQRLTDLAFKTLLQAFRRQAAIWQSFAQDLRVEELHNQLLFDRDPILSAGASIMIKNFCLDPSSSEDVADFYLTTLLALVPQALSRRDRATQFFDLATEILVADRVLRRDEMRVREITSSLISTLWNYEHVEKVALPIADTAVTGLLKMVTEAIAVMKSFKKPLELGNLSTQLLERLLFPPQKDPNSRPLVHQQSRRLAFQIVQTTCESRETFASLLDATIAPLYDADKNPTAKYPGQAGWLRPVWKCSGLPNLGMTCYMNSLIQQLFANVHFRKFILETPVMDLQRQALLMEVQNLFASMQDSYAAHPDTVPLAKVLNIQTDSQEDVHGFYEDFLSRLEAHMPDAESKAKLTAFFTGKLISQIKGECGHISPKTEPFVDLPVIVKNKTCLSESLDEFVQGEPMEGANKYKCLACDTANGGRLVNAMRRACPEELPDNLTFCLKRFTFEAMLGMDGKVNDRFEFPQTIDMSKYERAALEDLSAKRNEDLFELVGVIVHQGTLHLGHYWSYTLLRNTAITASRVWVKLEDRNVTLVQNGLAEVQHECVGGQRYNNGNERADNAYVLFYQRKSSLEACIALPGPITDSTTQTLLPPKVPVSAEQTNRIFLENAWRHRIAHLFEDDFSSFVLWLLSAYKIYRTQSPASSSSDSPEDTASSETSTEASEDLVADDLLQKTSQVAMAYIQRVAVCDPSPMAKLEPVVAQLKKLICDQPAFVAPLVQLLIQDQEWFPQIFAHDTKAVRNEISGLVIDCLVSLRQTDHSLYQEAWTKLLQMHAFRMRNPPLLAQLDIGSYSLFAARLASLGAEETAAVLNQGYWLWALGMLSLPFDASARKRLPNMVDHVRNHKDKASALYELLFQLLDGYADVSDIVNGDDSDENDAHEVIGGRVPLTQREFDALFHLTKSGAHRNVLMWLRAAKLADKSTNWKDSAPGKLLGILVSNQSAPQVRDAIEQSLVTHVDVEEESLQTILNLVLHFYFNSDERERSADSVFKTLVKVIHMWEGSEVEFLETVKIAYTFAPCTVLWSLDGWVGKFLEVTKAEHIRTGTTEWLCQVFDNQPITTYPELDSARAHQARKLANYCLSVLEQAYAANKSRTRYQPMVVAVLHIAGYLKKLKEVATEMAKCDDEEIRDRVTIRLHREIDEVDTMLQGILQMDVDVFRQWVLEPTLTTSTLQDVRRSVELAASDDLESDSEDWDEDDESIVAGPR